MSWHTRRWLFDFAAFARYPQVYELAAGNISSLS
jgi:hypothetical protein